MREYETFKEYYKHLNPNKLFLPDQIKYIHFRIWAPKPIKISHILKTKKDVRDMLAHYGPMHAFYVTSYFLQPNKLGPRGRDRSMFLFSPEFIIDLDSKSGFLDEEIKYNTLDIISFIRNYYALEPNLIVFSGQKGFHIHYPFPFGGFAMPTNEKDTILLKEKLIKIIEDGSGIRVDEPVTKDTRRLMRIPGSVHGRTGNLVEVIRENDILHYTPKHVVDVSKYLMKHGSAQDIEEEVLGYNL